MSRYLDLYINQGESYTKSLTAYDSFNSVLNLSGATGYCQFRTSYYSSNYKEGEISITGATGVFQIGISATASASFKPTRYVYDIEFHYPDGTVVRTYQGSAFIDPEVTK